MSPGNLIIICINSLTCLGIKRLGKAIFKLLYKGRVYKRLTYELTKIDIDTIDAFDLFLDILELSFETQIK